MSKPKQLDLDYTSLVNIAKEINKNTFENKTRSKEKKISTDLLLKNKFNINRKNFSFSIKNTDIKYNPSTHLYDIGSDNYKNNTKITQHKDIQNRNHTSNMHLPDKNNTLVKNNKMELELKKVLDFKKEVLDLLNIKDDLIDMLDHHKNNQNVMVIPELNINNIPEKLQKKIVTKSIKIYEPIYKKFNNLCSKYPGIKKQDLISLCILEFIYKYKK